VGLNSLKSLNLTNGYPNKNNNNNKNNKVKSKPLELRSRVKKHLKSLECCDYRIISDEIFDENGNEIRQRVHRPGFPSRFIKSSRPLSGLLFLSFF
jgi:hypothetical protein